jgi:hypothetical protein
VDGLGVDVAQVIGLSLKVAFWSVVLSLPPAMAVAWLLARRDFPGKVLFDAVVHLPLVLPPVVVGFVLLLLLGRNGPLGALLAPLGIVFAFRWTGAALAAAVMGFPLLVRASETDEGVVRTILAVNEQDQSMTFAGDVPQGSYARLMKANFDRLIDGATGAAQVNAKAMRGQPVGLAILISCVGRRLVLRQRTEEEVEAVREVLGSEVALTGYYSYGEISPLVPGVGCNLHNQTMTITTLGET